MNKTQTWNAVSTEVKTLLESSKVAQKTQNALLDILESYLAPKVGGGGSVNPPITDENGEIIEAWCRYHQRYEPANDMVLSGGKSKGYCKASASKSNKLRKAVKDKNEEAMKFMAEGDFDTAQKLAAEAKAIQDTMNNPEGYDYELDWAEFRTSEESTEA